MCSLLLLCCEEKAKNYGIYGIYFYKRCSSLCLVSGRNENDACQSCCSWYVFILCNVFPAALQWVTLGFLEKISSAVACAGSYIYFFNGSLKVMYTRGCLLSVLDMDNLQQKSLGIRQWLRLCPAITSRFECFSSGPLEAHKSMGLHFLSAESPCWKTRPLLLFTTQVRSPRNVAFENQDQCTR